MKKLILYAVFGGLGLLFGTGQVTFSSAATIGVPCGQNINTVLLGASPGDVVELGACAYPGQNFTSTVPATVQGQTGTVLGDVDAHGAQHITFRDLSLRSTFLVPQNGSAGGRLSADLNFINVTMTNGGIFVRGLQGGSFVGGSSGNTHDAYSQTIGTYAGLAPSRDILVDRWRFHDMDRSANTGGHMECLFIQESERVTVKDSLFENCSIMDVFVSPIVSSNVPTNITITGNTFRTPTPERGGGAFLINPDPGSLIANYLFQGNQWDDRMLIENDGAATITNVVWCSDNTGSTPALLEPDPGFSIQDCGTPTPTTTVPTDTSPTTTVPTDTSPTTTVPTDTSPTTTAPVTTTTPGCQPDPGHDSCEAEIASLKAQLEAWTTWEATHP